MSKVKSPYKGISAKAKKMGPFFPALQEKWKHNPRTDTFTQTQKVGDPVRMKKKRFKKKKEKSHG